MAYQDLRDFMAALKANNELLEVDRAIKLSPDVGQALQKSQAISGPAILFENNGTSYPLVGGLYNSRKKALLAFQCTEDNIFEYVLAGLAKPIEPVIVATAVVQENSIAAADVDLSTFPIPKYNPNDGGPYITAGVIVSKDLVNGSLDIGNYRFQVIDKNTFSFLAQPNHRLGKHITQARNKGLKTYSIALVIGVDPVLAFTCQFQLTDSTNDFAVCGGLRGAAVELVNCKTIDLQVPAYAEFVFELEIDLTQDVFEGPLGEYTGYYTPGSMKPIAKIKTVTHRNDAIFQALLTGVPPTENHILKQIPFETSFFSFMQKSFPSIKRVAIPASGGVSFYVIIAMEPRFAGEAREAILAAISTNVRPKMVIIVNTDIDIRNSDQVEWAMSFRMQPQEDVIIINNVPAGPLDPSVADDVPLDSRLASAIGIDATYPFGYNPNVPSDKTSNSKDHNKFCFKEAEIPGWQTYDFPELTKFVK